MRSKVRAALFVKARLLVIRGWQLVNDPYNLQRFVLAQDKPFGASQSTVYDKACEELRHGRKQGHWMWFIFPQVTGLGASALSHKYAITSLAEAEAYLLHPVLGSRLRACTMLMNQIEGRTAPQILGPVDALKFRSSMTLFAHARADNQVFMEALNKYYQGRVDELTLARLSSLN